MTKECSGCAKCPFQVSERICQKEDGKAPPFCPTVNKPLALKSAVDELRKPEIYEFAKQASIQEGEGYANKELGYERAKPVKPRIVEIIEFAHRMGYRKLGLAFCMGLRDEARVVESILIGNGFEVASVLCKIGREPKETLGIENHQKIKVGAFEAMCNPVAQAFVMNDEKTQLNILLGLCVGHDSLFLKYSQAPCTVFAVKDRLLGHNPLAVIYNINSYYRSLKFALSE